MQPGTFEVNEVPEGSCHVGEPVLLDPAYRLRLGVENRLVGVNLIKIAKQLIGSFDQQGGEIGVQLCAGAPPDLGHSNIGICVRGEHHRSQGDLHDSRGQRDRLAGSVREALAIPHREHLR